MTAPIAVAGYRGAVELLRQASRGSYRGPMVPAAELMERVMATDGLDPGALLEQTRLAAGSSDSTSMRGGIFQQVTEFISQAALGEILGRLSDTVRDFFDNREQSQELEHSAESAGEALTDIEEVSETGIDEIVLALRAVIEQLSGFLGSLDPAEYPHEFAECVASGADLIDSAGAGIIGCCQDRDEAVAGCLNELLDRGNAVCESNGSYVEPEVVSCESSPTAPVAEPSTQDCPTLPQSAGSSSSAPALPTCPPTAAPTGSESLAQAQGGTGVVGETFAASSTAQTAQTAQTGQGTVSAQECPTLVVDKQECPTPAVVEECSESTAESGQCNGVLGALGIGVALIGLGLLLHACEEAAACAEVPADTLETEPEPEPPAPEPETPAEPSPPSSPDEVIAPPEALAEVEEPPAPPKKNLPIVETAAVESFDNPPLAEQPQAAADSYSASELVEPAPVETPGGARKAGKW
ncbi:hypothetical protein [Corynebacterium alimapuense]|uniref:Uncharacterized protein n=1 Tax=Corynebacterium alimapuense TaxID=1576874 RepID=A0A3M8K8Q9_9CORY|nr:hypothetical protein [Corynebacterium alimapuense]RNE48848.1 hypothetical protein C5L39_06005 [Corynebacterium alimapuense]